MATVHITHPGLPTAKPAITSQEAFDTVWEKKGWKTVSPAEALELEQAATAEAAAPPVNLAKAKTGSAA